MGPGFLAGRIGRRSIIAGAGLLAAPALRAQGNWPDRPITFVVSFPPGGSTDLSARLIAPGLGELLGKPIVFENRGGAGGNIAMGYVARATPDGYTFLVASSVFVVNSSLYKKAPYDPFRDYAPVATLSASPNVVCVRTDSPIRSLNELIALAKARPGELTFGSSGIGASSHLAGELLKARAGIDVTHVPFRGSGPAIAEVIAGRISFVIDTLLLFTEYRASGAVRAIAVAGASPSRLMPDLPTIAETLPGFESGAFNYLAGPAGLPEPVIRRLNTEVNAILADPGFRQRLDALGLEPMGGTPEATEAHIRAEAARWREVILAARITAE